MKRILFVLALTLILSVCFVGEAFAFFQPRIPVNTGDTGEEHPWGGDDSVTDPPTVTTKPGSYITYTTGYVVVDLIFTFFYIDDVNISKNSYVEKQSLPSHRIEFQKYSSLENEGIRK